MTLYPLKFTPIIKDYLWGGSRLEKVLHKRVVTPTAAESWEVSGVAENISVVSEGLLKGRDLKSLLKTYGKDLAGNRVYERFGNEFPVLIKFIDAEKDLSVQLHPDDTLARERHGTQGKTEMWHIMHAEPGAELILGFEQDTNKEEFLKALKEERLLNLLHSEKVGPGDTFFIHPGKVHAIGKGVLLVEIQQTSDITYRVYDYNRKDRDGKPRELHTDLALDAIDFSSKGDFRIDYEQLQNTPNPMVSSPFFHTNFLHVDSKVQMDVSERDSFHIYICTEGSAGFITREGRYELKMGETLLIPACIGAFAIDTDGAKFLEVHL